VARKLATLLRRNWLEGAIDSYLLSREDSFGKGEPMLIHASWLLDDAETIFKRLIGLGKEERRPSARLLRMFDDGMDTQRRYIKYFREMKILDEPEGWDEERGIEVVDEEYGIIGHIDCRIWTPEGICVPVELKAYNSTLFRRYRYRSRVEHYHQLQMYIYLDKAPYGYLLPENKDNQEINPVKVPRDELVINAALAKASEVWSRVRVELGGLSHAESRSKLFGILSQARNDLGT